MSPALANDGVGSFVMLLVMLLAIQDLSLPELLFIACVVSLLGQFQEAGRRLPEASSLVFSMASAASSVSTFFPSRRPKL